MKLHDNPRINNKRDIATETKPSYAVILGVKVHTITHDQVLFFIDHHISTKQRAIISHVNIHAINIAYHLPWFRSFLNRSEIVFCDGFGVKWGAKILGYNIPERITYADWTWQLADFAERRNLRLYFLGARPGIAEMAAQRLHERYPRLQIVGTYDGYFDKRKSSAENKAVIHRINNTKPDILIVGFGMPLQERWLLENWSHLDVKIALTGGAVFDYISGNLRRGPRWMTDNGLEWLARLIIEPRRLWRRYIIGNPLFLWRILKQRMGVLRLPEQE